MSGILFPLKLTTIVDLVGPLGQHILKRNGESTYKETAPSLNTMQKLRESLDFFQMQYQLKADYTQGPAFQQRVIRYANYLYLIHLILEKDFTNPGIKILFAWNNSFDEKKKLIEVAHINYELASILYNLGIIYYTEAIYLTAYVDNIKNLLQSIKNFKHSLWCIVEAKKMLVPILNIKGVKLPPDLAFDFLTMLYNYIQGLIYYTQAIVQKQEIQEEDLIAYYESSAQAFIIANEGFEKLKKYPFESNIKKGFHANLLSNIALSKTEAYYRMAVLHTKLSHEDKTKDHALFAYSYLKASLDLLEPITGKKGAAQYVYPSLKDFLQRKNLEIKGKMDELFLNQKIDKKKVYNYATLAELPHEKSILRRPIEPPQLLPPENIRSSIPTEDKFYSFFPTELSSMRQEFLEKVTDSITEMEDRFKNLVEIKNKRYSSSSHINYLLSFDEEGPKAKKEIPSDLKTKIDKFRQNGGYLRYEGLLEQLKTCQRSCEEVIYEIKLELAYEKQEDDKARECLKESWKRVPSNSLNQEYIQSLISKSLIYWLIILELEQKYVFAVNTDNDIIKKYEKYVDWMLKFSDNDEYILSIIPESKEIEFWLLNKEKITELSGLHKKLINIIDPEKVKEKMKKLYEKVTECGLIYLLWKIYCKEASKQTEFDKIIRSLNKDLLAFEVKVSKFLSMLTFRSKKPIIYWIGSSLSPNKLIKSWKRTSRLLSSSSKK